MCSNLKFHLASCKAIRSASFPPWADLSSITVVMCGANHPLACLASIDCKSFSKLGHCKVKIPEDDVPTNNYIWSKLNLTYYITVRCTKY